MSHSSRFALLPPELVNDILTRLSAHELCMMECVGNHGIQLLAANLDETWRRLIPVELKAIIFEAYPFLNGMSFKYIYRHLANPPFIRLHFNKLILSGDVRSEKYSCVIGAGLINPMWLGGWIRAPNVFARFPDALILSSQGSFQLDCRVETLLLSVGTRYEAYLVFRISNGGFGFQSTPLSAGYTYTKRQGDPEEMMAEAGEEDEDSGEDTDEEEVMDGEDFYVAMGEEIAVGVNLPYSRADHLMEVKLVSFFLGQETTTDVIITLAAPDAPIMHGLMIESIEIRPVI